MKLHKTIFLGLLGAVASTTVAQAQNVPEVIYKIHDVQPVKEDNQVVACDFSVTFFNRAPQMVSNLSMNFSWLDDVIENQIKAEKKEQVMDKDGTPLGYSGKSKTEEYTSKKISVNISVPPLPVSKQISLKSTIKTDRCFLLLQKPQMTLTSCRYGQEQSEADVGICRGLFKYISPEEGDYYTDFKPISYDQEQQETEVKNHQEKKEMEEIYQNALNSVRRIKETLNTMN